MSSSSSLPPALMKDFSQFLLDKMGLHFPMDSWRELEKKLEPISQAFGFESVKPCLEWLMSTPFTQKNLDILAAHLTIGETYFFRDERLFQALKERILPDLIHSHQHSKHLRIWSAACCTGEEPYSVAIVLQQLLSDPSWSIYILGTDINIQFLHKAEAAQYKPWSFRSTPHSIKASYFTQNPAERFTLIPKIRKMVKFRYLNLIEGNYPSPLEDIQSMDLILCNNVLIYFSLPFIQKVVQHLVNTLNEGGWLCVTPIEVPYIIDARLTSFKIGDMTLFKKRAQIKQDLPPISSPLPTLRPLPKVIPQHTPPITTATLASSPKKSIYERAWTAYQQENYQETSRLLEDKFKEQSFLNDQESFLLIKAYLYLSKLDLADQWCEKMLNQNKLDPTLHYLHAQVLQELNRFAEAIKVLKRALFLEPNFVVAHFALGNLLLIQGNPKEANRHFRNVLNLLQKYPPETSLPGEENLTAHRLLDLAQGLTKQLTKDVSS